MKEYEFHPYASVLPMLGQTDLNELAADIQGNGLREDIVLLDGKILDGRNRYKACGIAQVEPRFRDFNGDGDPVDYIVSVNIKRRHLTQSQKAMVVAKVAQLPRGDISRITKTPKTPINSQTALSADREAAPAKSAAQVAKEVGVGTRTVEQAKQVLREASPETVKQVEQGEKSTARAVKEIKEAKAAPKNEKLEKPKRLDKTGYVIPDSVLSDWDAAEAYRSKFNDLHRILISIEKAVDGKERPLRFLEQSFAIDLRNAWRTLKEILPYAVCPTCQGRNREKCTVCKHLGYVPEFGYKNWFPKETIELRERAIKK